MRFIAAGLLLLASVAEAGTTIGPEAWNLYRGVSIVDRDFPSLEACAQAADDRDELRDYTCRTSVRVTVTADAPPPPPPPPPTGDQVISDADLQRIPWHNGSGAWGSQVRLEFPAQPVTTRSVSVSTREQFNVAASVAGSQITITSGWGDNTTATVNANDVDVVIPAGVSIGAIEFGVWPRSTAIARVRIRGGGRMGQYRDHALVSDVTLDGIDLNGGSGFGGSETNQAFRAYGTRIAVLNTRAIAGAYVWLGSARHVVIRNSNLYHGAASIAQLGSDPGGWGIRNTSGPITILDSRIQGTRYNNLRMQAAGVGQELLYVARTTFVNTAEGPRPAWLWDNQGNGNFFGQGAVIEDSSIYGPGCGFFDLSARHARYSRVRGSRFYNVGSQSSLDSAQRLAGGDHDWSGNTFPSFAGLPAWGNRGDPTQVPLPPGLTLVPRGTGSCVASF